MCFELATLNGVLTVISFGLKRGMLKHQIGVRRLFAERVYTVF